MVHQASPKAMSFITWQSMHSLIQLLLVLAATGWDGTYCAVAGVLVVPHDICVTDSDIPLHWDRSSGRPGCDKEISPTCSRKFLKFTPRFNRKNYTRDYLSSLVMYQTKGKIWRELRSLSRRTNFFHCFGNCLCLPNGHWDFSTACRT